MLQNALNGFRQRQLRILRDEYYDMSAGDDRDDAERLHEQYKLFVFPEDKHRHEKPSQGLDDMVCKPVEAVGRRHWNCVLRRCCECLVFPTEEIEDQLEQDSPSIQFHNYVPATKCSLHGGLELKASVCENCEHLTEGKKKSKISTRKYLTFLTRPIGVFMRDHYRPALEALATHLPHVQILSNNLCGRMRADYFKSMPYSVKTIRDYAEALKMEFNNEIQSEHFGNSRALSIEGSSVRMFNRSSLAAYEQNIITVDELVRTMETHSHFSAGKRQDARTTFENMHVLVQYLFKEGIIKEGSTILDHTDGCSKQYRSATVLYCFSLLAASYGITIDRAIGASGHGT
jgi:hypothetical protein